MNVAEQIALSCRQFPERIALSDGQGSYTYQEIGERIENLAAHLIEAGLAPGDRVAAFLPNSRDYVVLLYAALRVGAVFVPLNYRFASQELQYTLADSGSRFLAVRAGDLPRVLPVLADTDVSQLILHEPAEEALVDLGPYGAQTLREIYARPSVRRVQVAQRKDDDDALIMYTSGTTGRPKGVRQTHRNNSASIEMVAAAWRLVADDRLLQALPLFHVGGLQCSTLPALAVGARVHFLGRWDAAEWLAQQESLRPTFSGLVTTMLIDVVARLEAGARPTQPSSLRFCVFGGSATPRHVPQRFEELLGAPMIELYGQTETTGLIVTYDADEPRVPGSMGRLRREVADAVLIGADGAECTLRAGEVGEIAFTGDTVTAGYWHRQTETQGRRHGPYLRTGDVVRVGEGDYLYYIDRADNMIVTGGENVYPAEVEEVLSRHPKVAEVAVIGTPHERLVEQVTAVVVSKDPALSADELLAFVLESARIAPYKRPRRVEFVQDLPKTGSGKIDRGRLRADIAGMTANGRTEGS